MIKRLLLGDVPTAKTVSQLLEHRRWYTKSNEIALAWDVEINGEKKNRNQCSQ